MITADSTLPFLSDRRFHWALIVACSVFCFLFLLLFLPFGVNEPKRPVDLLFAFQLSWFALLAFLTLVANELLIRRHLRVDWTLNTFLAWVAWLIFSTGTTNFLLYNYLQHWYDLSWVSYARHVFNVGLTEFFPIAGVFFYYRMRSLNTRLATLRRGATDRDILATPVRFTGRSEREYLKLELRQFLFAEAANNYVVIHYRDGTSRRKQLLRGTLTELEAATYPVDFLLRIHRSYLVNAYRVEHLRGNVQKSELKLRYLNHYVPVSRGYVHAVREHLATFFNTDTGRRHG